uniref:hypothetical protein n=1 Tax=Thaumasiovibrio occultus TaxID=1891184 RepID=UPI000B34F35E|nr:hypothetical protein [Thaumasiovibrio occultus]
MDKQIKHLILFIVIWLLSGLTAVSASEPQIAHSPNVLAQIEDYSTHDRMVLATLATLTEHQHLSEESANSFAHSALHDSALRQQLYAKADVRPPENPLWKEYLTLTNVLKVTGVLLLVAAISSYIYRFFGFFNELLRHLWELLIAVPAIFYQVTFSALGLALAFNPTVISTSHANYVVIFGALLNVCMLVWLLDEYEDKLEVVLNIVKLGLPDKTAAYFYLTLYFGYFAFANAITFFAYLTLFCLLNALAWSIKMLIGKKAMQAAAAHVTTFYLAGFMTLLAYYSAQQISAMATPLAVFDSAVSYVLLPCSVLALGFATIKLDERSTWVTQVAVLILFALAGAGLALFQLGFQSQVAMINSVFVCYLFFTIVANIGKVLPLLSVFVGGGLLFIIALLIEHAPERFIPVF